MKHSWLPQVLVAVWLTFVGWAIWQHVERSEQPPVYDALTYFQKAKNFWASLHRVRPANPFNLEPTVRPPGTVLMSYPFGFKEDFDGFYFRSVFLPILFLVAAVYVIGYPRAKEGSEHWNLAVVALYLSTLPMFYHLELREGSPVSLGLVDNFLAGVAALAVAACARSVKDGSVRWLIAAVLLASLCLLIKPAGLLIIAIVGVSWLLMALIRLKFMDVMRDEQKGTKKLLAVGLALMCIIFGAVVAASFTSKYFSPDNVAFGNRALHVMGEEWLAITPYALHAMIHTGFGYPLLFWVMIPVVFFFVRWKRIGSSSAGWSKPLFVGLIAAACLYLAAGSWFWLFKTGGSQVRYFYPFALMAVTGIIPIALWGMECMSPRKRIWLWTLLIIPVINLALLLGQDAPSVTWQGLTGVNLSSGTHKEEIRMAKGLLNELSNRDTVPVLYSINLGPPTVAFESVSGFEWVSNPSKPNHYIRRPVDWDRPSVYRLNEICEADYILFEPVRDPAKQIEVLGWRTIDSFEQESLLMQVWFTGLAEKDGVVVVSEVPKLRLLKVKDRFKLEARLANMEAQYNWRREFLEANPRRWWNEQDVAGFAKSQNAEVTEVRFGDSFKLHALSLNRNENEITVRLWWERLRDTPNEKWFFFFHSIDSMGNIVGNHQLLLNQRKPISLEQNIQFDTITFNNPPENKAVALATGIFHLVNGAASTLPADNGLRDWDNRRVIIPLSRGISSESEKTTKN